MKKIHSIFSLLFALCFAFALSTNCAAVDQTEMSFPVSAAARDFFEARGVCVAENARMKLVEVATGGHGKPGYALCLTQFKNGIYTNEYILLVEEDENHELKLTNGIFSLLQTSSSQNVDFPPLSWDGRYMIHATASWTTYPNAYVRPLSLTWYYEIYESGTDVSYISVNFECEGSLYTYPEYTFIQSDYVHSIIKNASNPVVNREYYAYNALLSNRAMDCTQGGPMVGMFVTFNAVVDGHEEFYTVPV